MKTYRPQLMRYLMNATKGLLVVALLAASLLSQAQQGKIQSGIIYYFTKYMVWPGEKTAGDFNIYLVGDDEIDPYLKSMVSEKKVAGAQSMKYIKVGSIDEVQNGHIVFLGSSKLDQFENAKAAAESQNFLLVTAKSGLGKKGAGCNFVIRDGKPAFELNQTSLQACNLKAGTKLKTLGIALK